MEGDSPSTSWSCSEPLTFIPGRAPTIGPQAGVRSFMVFAWFIVPAEEDVRPKQFSGDGTPQDLWFPETLKVTGLGRAGLPRHPV